tara:strand:- start:219 stop:437 length:219 start_codon:yes stop_codon:yes gene_type:complete
MASVEIVCAAKDGFRVHERYFVDKPRFAPGVCPRCGGPVHVVKPATYTRVEGAAVSLVTGSVTEGAEEEEAA